MHCYILNVRFSKIIISTDVSFLTFDCFHLILYCVFFSYLLFLPRNAMLVRYVLSSYFRPFVLYQKRAIDKMSTDIMRHAVPV